MSDTGLPDLDAIPTQPPPPPPPERIGDMGRARAPRPPRVRASGTWWRVLVLFLACQGAIVVSAVLVAVEKPSVGWAVAAVALTDVFIVVVTSMMLGMVGRTR